MTYVETWLTREIGRRVTTVYDPMQKLFISEAATSGATKIAQGSDDGSMGTAQFKAVRKFEQEFPDA